MESSSWIHGGYANANANANANGTGNNGFMCGYAASCIPGEFQPKDQQQQLLSSQIQHHLNQISMHMSMDDDQSTVYDGAAMDDLLMPSSTHHASFPSSSSSTSASYRSTSVSYSPDTSAATAAHVLGAPTPAPGFIQFPEVSSHAPLTPTFVPYEPQHSSNYTGLSPATELLPSPAASGGAFRRYARHLGPRRPAAKASGGQRMFKTAMSVLSKMHVAAMAYSRQCYYKQQQQAAAAEAAPPSGNQLQHMISERKRREKLNDSFVALKSVLPPGSKKDKTSILIRAREYVKSLESKLEELEEKNRELEARLASRATAAAVATTAPPEAAAGEKGDLVEIEVTSGGDGGAGATAATGEEESTCTLNVAVTTPPASRRGGGGMSTTDVVLRTLQCLREQIGDGASLVALSTSAGSGGRPPRANLTLQLKV